MANRWTKTSASPPVAMNAANAPHDPVNHANCALFMLKYRIAGTSAYAKQTVLGHKT